MEIKFIDTDVVDVNIKVAEQFLIKASVEENNERMIKSLLFAKESINNALSPFDINIKEVKNKRSLSKNIRQTPK